MTPGEFLLIYIGMAAVTLGLIVYWVERTGADLWETPVAVFGPMLWPVFFPAMLAYIVGKTTGKAARLRAKAKAAEAAEVERIIREAKL